jgi:periplasmic protein TonB
MKNLLAFSLSFSFFVAHAQDKNQFYALDAKMNQTVLDSSKYILWIHETDSARWQWDYYLTWGPLVKSTTYADHDGTIRNGRFCIYNKMGNLDSTGFYNQGKKNGTFYKLKSYSADSITIVSQSQYADDSLVKFTEPHSIYPENKIADSAEEKKPSYPGGNPAWQKYISDNLRYPDRAKSKDIFGQVRIYFTVDKEGNISDPFIQKSKEYSLDQEALRLIKNSGKWEPAMKSGLQVSSGQTQYLNFDPGPR